MGLEWDGHYLLYAAGFSNMIYRLDISDGHVVSSFPSAAPFPTGLTFTGEVWSAQTGCNFLNCSPHQVVQEDLIGNVAHTFKGIGQYPTGLAFDGHFLWHSDNSTDLIYKIDPATFAVLGSFSAPSAFPNDLAWDGATLWVISNYTGRLYQYDVSGLTSVSAGTWGRLKSHYR
jgi:hypothetical protein